MKPTDRVVRNPALALAPSEDGYLAYDTKSKKLHRLNPAAALIVELSDGTRDVATISAQLAPLLPGLDSDVCSTWIQHGLKEKILYKHDAKLPKRPTGENFWSTAKKLRHDGEVLASFVCQDYAVGLDPDHSYQWCALAEIAHIVGRRERAREAYERYLVFEPDDAEVAQILVALRDEAPPPRAPNKCIEQLYERFSKFYEKNMVGDLKFQGPARINEALVTQPDLQKKDLEILELGCGTGLVAEHLRPRARKLIGIDLSPHMVQKAKATNLYDLVEVAEITDWLSRDPNLYDLVVACDTFIYFGDLRQVLAPSAARLKPGGFMVFTVEKGEKPPFKLTDSGRYTHTTAHIEEAAKEAGFNVLSINEGFLRKEYGDPVTCLIALIRKS
jgi:predicted TPR repeat methyltransferase